MAEVFTISGAEAAPAPCPVGWQVTPKGNCGAPVAGCPPAMQFGRTACRSSAAVALQNVLRALGLVAKDPGLALVIDGFVGPATAAATNRAFTTHIGSGQAPAELRTGQLSIAEIAARAPQLIQLAAAEVARRGGTVPAPPVLRPPTRKEVAEVEPLAPSYPKALWALFGLNVLVAATGFYVAWQPSASRMAPVIPLRVRRRGSGSRAAA